MQRYLLSSTNEILTKSYSNLSSSRTIVMDEIQKVRLEEMTDVPIQQFTTQQSEVSIPLDIQTIQIELKNLILYLSQSNNPTEQQANQHFKVLERINPLLIPIIVQRHFSQRKTKEEQTKFVLRKCSKFLKNQLQIQNQIISALEMEKLFYKEYFDGGEDMIPFREKSSLKTMNSQFLKKIFRSEKYVEGFKNYLQNFDQIWEEENQEKVTNMVKQVVKLIQSNKVEKLRTYRRIPWNFSIKDDCKRLGISMLEYAYKGDSNSHKQIKLNMQYQA